MPDIKPPLHRIKTEVAFNYDALQRLRVSLARYEGQYALMRSGMIVDYFASTSSANLAGHERFLDQIFSIHRIRTAQTARPNRSYTSE